MKSKEHKLHSESHLERDVVKPLNALVLLHEADDLTKGVNINLESTVGL